LRTLLLSIAAISLLSAASASLNIMLVSVTERTREIGIRMAIGAKGRHVLLQFLFEAVTLAIGGGLLGIGIGIGASELVKRFLQWPIVVHARLRDPLVRRCCCGWDLFWVLPSAKGIAARSHRRIALRIAGLA